MSIRDSVRLIIIRRMRICAAMLVYAEIKKLHGGSALGRMMAVINDVDHFRDVLSTQRQITGILDGSDDDGWRLIHADNPIRIMELGFQSLDGIYKVMLNKIWAKKNWSML